MWSFTQWVVTFLRDCKVEVGAEKEGKVFEVNRGPR